MNATNSVRIFNVFVNIIEIHNLNINEFLRIFTNSYEFRRLPIHFYEFQKIQKYYSNSRISPLEQARLMLTNTSYANSYYH